LPAGLVQRRIEEANGAEHADAFAHGAERVAARRQEHFAIVVCSLDERKDGSMPAHDNWIGLVEDPRPTEKLLARASVLGEARLVNVDDGSRSNGLSFAASLKGGHVRLLSRVPEGGPAFVPFRVAPQTRRVSRTTRTALRGLFVRRGEGSIAEAGAYERRIAADLLAVNAAGVLDPMRGLELPTQS